MPCYGVFFALTDDERNKLQSFGNDEDRISYLQEEIEEKWDEDYLCSVDTAWDTIHQILSDFPPGVQYFYPVEPEHGPYALPEDHGQYPLKQAVLGGQKLVEDEKQYFIRLVEAQAVPDIADALRPLSFEWFETKYKELCQPELDEYGEESVQIDWEAFCEMRDFYKRMAGNGRAIIFTAPQ